MKQAYQKLCQAKTKTASTKAINELLRLSAAQAWEKIATK